MIYLFYFVSLFALYYFLKTREKKRIKDILKTLDKDENYIFVSHEPFISNWIYQLTGDMKIISRGSINFVEINPKEFTE